jgi:putative peptidoglycan lipid II flippase
VLLVSGILVSATLPSSSIAFGIAVSTTVADFALVIVAALLLRRRMHGLGTGPVARSYLVFLLALLPAAAAGVGLDFAFGSFSAGFALSGILQAIVSIAAIGAVMAVIYFGVLALLRSPELSELTAPLVRRLRPGK